MNKYPKTLYFMIDILCNEKCSKCNHWKNETQRLVYDISKVSRFVKDASSINEVVIVGGEPLIYKKDLVELIQDLPQHIRTTIITNGVLANKDFIDFIYGKNVHIIFSIDTLDEDFWKFVRGNETYDKVMRNLDYAYETLVPNQLSVQSVLSKETMLHVKNVAKWCESRGVYHSVQDYVQDGFEGNWTELKKEKVVNDENCYAYLSNMSILPNGDIYTCFQQNLISKCSKPIGNINTDSFHEVMNQTYTYDVLDKMKECQLPCRVLKCNIESSDFNE